MGETQLDTTPVDGLPLKKTVDQLVAEATSKDYFNITRGFQTDNQQEFFSFMVGLMKKQVLRVPIIGFKNKRVFALAQAGKPLEHRQLLENLNKMGGSNKNDDDKRKPLFTEDDVEFTASLETLHFSGLAPTELAVRLSQVDVSQTSQPNHPVLRIRLGSDALKVQIGSSKEFFKNLFRLTGIKDEDFINW